MPLKSSKILPFLNAKSMLPIVYLKLRLMEDITTTNLNLKQVLFVLIKQTDSFMVLRFLFRFLMATKKIGMSKKVKLE